MEQTKTNAGAFVDAAKLQMDGGFRNLTNNIALELFGSGTATRGVSSAASSQTSATPNVVTITLTNAQQIVAFEVGQLIVASATDGGAPSADSILISSVNRSTGVIVGSYATGGAMSSNWAIGSGLAYLTVSGDLPSAGATSTGSYLALSGLAAWLPVTSPASNDSFWGVNRSADPTRLAGCRFNAQSMTIEEGMTNALAFLNREGGKPDLCVMDFTSYAALVNALGKR